MTNWLHAEWKPINTKHNVRTLLLYYYIFKIYFSFLQNNLCVSLCCVVCVCERACCDVFKCPSPLYSIFYSPFCPYSRRSSCSSKLVGCFPFLKDFMRQPPHPPLAPNVNLKKKKRVKKGRRSKLNRWQQLFHFVVLSGEKNRRSLRVSWRCSRVCPSWKMYISRVE